MKRFRWLPLFLGLALLLPYFSQRRGQGRFPVDPAVSPVKIEATSGAAEAAHGREPAMESAPAPAAGIEGLLATARLLDERVIPGNSKPDSWRKSQLIESSFKYPQLQVDEWWQRHPDGSGRRISRSVHVADHAMVRFPPGFDREQVTAWCAGRGLSVRRKLATDDVFLIQVPGAGIDAVAGLIRDFKEAFGDDEAVALAEADHLVFADAIPSDPSFGSLWGLHNTGQSSGLADSDIDAPEAWSLSTGSRDVIVGVIDSGIDGTHPDLAANLWTNPGEIAGNGLDDDNNGFVDDTRGWDFYSNDADPSDPNGHGTHCAGTIGAVGDNATGVAGVNWNVSLVGLRFLSASGSGSTSDAVEAVNYARTAGITLTSNSWGGGSYSATLEQAIRAAGNAGQLFVAAAGNDAVDNDLIPHYPSSYNLDNVIAVASTTRTDTLSSFSCFGRHAVDLAAPGSDILSTVPGTGYGTKSGTSMATPHVAGVAALLYSISPGRSHIDMKDVLLQTVDPLPVLDGLCVSGGRLNAGRAAAYVAGPRVVPDSVMVVELSGNQDGDASPGERLALDVSFKNAGSEPAEDCSATLSLATPVPGVSVAGGPYRFAFLDPGETASPRRFEVTLDPALATPSEIALTFTVSSTGGASWTQDYRLGIHTVSHIRGQVTRLDGSGGIGGATVAFDGPRTGTVIADGSGHFEILAVDGTYMLQASADGYMPGEPVARTVPPAASGVELRLGTAEMQASPATLAEALLAGDAVTRTIQLHNPGNAALHWRVTTAYNRNGAMLRAHAASSEPDPDRAGTVHLRDSIPSIADEGVDLSGVTIGMMSGSLPVFSPEMASRGAVVTGLTLPLTPESLEELNLVVIDDAASSLTAADIALLREWTSAGGALLLEGDESYSMGNTNLLLADTGIQGVTLASFGYDTVTDILPHEITENVESIAVSSYGAYCAVSGDAEALARYPSGTVFAAVSTLGAGRVFLAGNEITYSSNWATGDTRRFLHQSVAWLASRQRWLKVKGENSGALPPGGTVGVEITVDAGFMEAGLHEARLVFSSDSTLSPTREIAVQLTVTDAPAIAFNPPQLGFSDTPLGKSETRDAVIVNPGTLELAISAFEIADPAFSAVLSTPVTLAPHERLKVPVTFSPDRLGACEGLMAVSTNDPSDPTANLPLSGAGKSGPVLTLSPGSFSVSAPQGTLRTESLLIGNAGDMPLEWSTRITESAPQAADPLVSLVRDLDAGQTLLAAALPGRFFFEGGITGYDIDQSSLFYSAGQLTTNLSPSSELAYSDGQVVAAPRELGPSGRYFTRKYPGLFIFCGELDGVASFSIDGSNALASEAILEGSEIPLVHRGRSYRGFVKRTHISSRPSIHHLVVVEDQAGIARSYPASASSESHDISGLGNTRRLYYLLFTGVAGSHYDDDEVRGLMRVFLSLCDADLPWAWTDVPSGIVAPGQTVSVPLHFADGLLAPGTHNGVLTLTGNQPGRPPESVPLALTVTPAPALTLSAEDLDFPETAAGSTSRVMLHLENQGGEPVELTPSIAPGGPMNLPSGQALSLAPGNKAKLAVDFAPDQPGDFDGELVLQSPGQPSRRIALHGAAVAPAPLAVSPRTLDLSMPAGSTATRTLALENTGGAAVDWTTAVLETRSAIPSPALGNVKGLVIDNSSSGYDQLLTRFKAAGANISLNPFGFSPSQLVGLNLVIIDGSLESYSSSNVQTLRSWISAGGSLILNNGSSSFSDANTLASGTGITFSSRTSVSSSTANLLPHPATRGVADVPVDYCYQRITTVAPATTIATLGGMPFGAVAPLGSGRIIAFTGEIFSDDAGETRHLDLAVSVAAWATGSPVGWLDLSLFTGQATSGTVTNLAATVKTTGLAAGDHFADIEVATSGPAGTVRVPVRVSVSGSPDLAVSPAAITLPAAHAGSFREVPFTIENRGAAPLRIGSITTSRDDLAVEAGLPLEIQAYGSVTLYLVHRPLALDAAFSASLTISSDDPDQALLVVPVSGSSLPPPVAGVTTGPPLRFTLAAGASTTAPLELSNQGATGLTWSVPKVAVLSSPTLANILPKLDASQASLTAAIPNAERFDGGTGGSAIDGGGLFLGANRHSTDLAEHITLDYSDGVVSKLSQCLGTGGSYFTLKYPGLFVFAADLAGVGEFRITGNLKAQAGSVVDGASLFLPRQQTAWRGFIKSVHGPGRRPVHHLVIVEDRPGLTRDFPSDATADDLVIGGLAGSTRLYHLLFTGSEGTTLDEPQAKGIMSAFLDAALGTPAFATVNPGTGTIPAGGQASTTLTVSAAGLNGGVYHSSLPVTSNDPLRPVMLVPVELTVVGTPQMTVSRTTAPFTPTFAGGQGTPLTATVSNSGTELLTISSLTLDPPFTVSPAEPFTLAPGAQRILTLGFAAPLVTGAYAGTLTIQSNAAALPTATIAMSGTSTPAPQATASATSFSLNLEGTLTASRSMNLSNPGGSTLQWTNSSEYAIYQAADGKDLAGVRVGLISRFDPFLRDLEARLKARGATVTYLSYASSPDPAPFDVILLDGVTNYLTSAYVATLRAWVEKGCGLMMAEDFAPSPTKINPLLSGTGMTFSNSSSGYVSSIPAHPINTGITVPWGGSYYGSFTLTPPALPLGNDTTFTRIAVGPLSKGWIIASGGVFYDVFARGSDIRFTDQCFSWLAGRLRPWITPGAASGSTVAGGTSPLTYSINAAGMLPGTYQATIKVGTNSPAQPSILIPVTLVVPAESSLLLSKSSITFAETKAGVPLSTTFTITHKGTVPVTLAALQLPPPFTVTGVTLPLTLKQGSSVTCTARFSPVEAGTFSGSIAFDSNAITPRAALPLSGRARLGPALAPPPPLHQATRFAGSTHRIPLQVGNAGLENLTWSAAVVAPSAPGTAAPALDGLRVGVFANNHTGFTGDLVAWGATVTSIPTNAGLLSPGDLDTIVIDGRMTSLVTAHFTALRDWVKAGGTLILEGSTWSCVSRLNSLIKDSGLTASHDPVKTATVTAFATHPVMQGVTTLAATDCEISLAATGSAVVLATMPDGEGFAGIAPLGKGRILALSQQPFTDGRYGTGSARILAANALSVIRPGRDSAWLSTPATAGTLLPGATTGFDVLIETAGLAPGTYRRALRIQSNDPLRPRTTVLIEIKVVAPVIADALSLDFGQVMTGDLATREITLTSSAEEELELTTSITPPFSLHAPASISISAAAPLLRLPLTFSPAAEGIATGTLFLETVAGPVEVALAGNGIPAGSFPLEEFLAWRSSHFPGGGPFTGMNDDPDRDGNALGIEYAFLRDPLLPDGGNPFTIVGRTPTGLRLRYTRRPTFPDSAILLETGRDLASWSLFTPGNPSISGNPDGSTTVEFEVPHRNAPKLFLRASVGSR